MLEDPDSVAPEAFLAWLRKHGYRYLVVDPAFQNFTFRLSGRGDAAYFKWLKALEETSQVQLIVQEPEHKVEREFRFCLYRILDKEP